MYSGPAVRASATENDSTPSSQSEFKIPLPSDFPYKNSLFFVLASLSTEKHTCTTDAVGEENAELFLRAGAR